MLCLAECERATSKIRVAANWAQRGAHLFHLLRDVSGEVDALLMFAHCASMLGRSEESVESALLAVRLLEDAPPGSRQKMSAFNYLGLAYCLSRNFAPADEALQQAVKIAQAGDTPAGAFQPRANQLYASIMRAATERYFLGHLPCTAGVTAAHAACAKLDRGQDTLVAGSKVIALALWALMSSIEATWSRNFERADADLAEGHAWAARYGVMARMNATEAWARVELAWAMGRLEEAERHAIDLISIASTVEHQQLACMGHLLLTQLLELQGKTTEALAETRRLRQREQAIRSEGLESRARVVAWQLEIRRSEGVMLQLTTASREFERLSMEDALTGIANRRFFERTLAQHLRTQAASQARLWIAFLDVDHFKQVNDRFSHAVGDRVLVRIAELLKANVRGKDLPARLGGDEFVVMLDAAQEQTAGLACDRISRAIQAEPWHSIAPGLHVAVSLGLACAEAGDTLESLLHRSDTAMYSLKRKRHASPGGEPVRGDDSAPDNPAARRP